MPKRVIDIGASRRGYLLRAARDANDRRAVSSGISVAGGRRRLNVAVASICQATSDDGGHSRFIFPAWRDGIISLCRIACYSIMSGAIAFILFDEMSPSDGA